MFISWKQINKIEHSTGCIDWLWSFSPRVNKRFFDAVSSSLTVFNGTEDKEWVQVYRGIAAGLGKEGFNFEKCVEDGNQTVAAFKESFDALQNKNIFKGLQLFGTALMDVVKAFKDCSETDIAKAIEKLAIDFIKCVKGNHSLGIK